MGLARGDHGGLGDVRHSSAATYDSTDPQPLTAPDNDKTKKDLTDTYAISHITFCAGEAPTPSETPTPNETPTAEPTQLATPTEEPTVQGVGHPAPLSRCAASAAAGSSRSSPR